MGDTEESLKNLFRKYDANGDGKISKRELGTVIKAIDSSWSDDALDELFTNLDRDGDGQIRYEEFLEWTLAAEEDEEGVDANFRAFSHPFLMELRAPNGQTWAEYLAPVRPDLDSDGRLIGAWFEAVQAGVTFELANPDWSERPEYTANGPLGYIIEFCRSLGYDAEGLDAAEEVCREILSAPAEEGSRAFLMLKARNGKTWEEYLRKSGDIIVDSSGFVSGAWGEAMTAAAIFERQNRQWNLLGPYAADGPCGQIYTFLVELDFGSSDELQATETATHEALANGRPVPVFDKTTYQVPVAVDPVPADDPAPSASGRKKALLIGCNYPGSSAQLSGCINDVDRWWELLQRDCGWEAKEALLLKDDGESDPKKKSTRANIVNAVRWLVQGAAPGDALFFQFSGHGGQKQCHDSSEEDGMDECLIPSDYQQAGVILDQELFDLMAVPLPSGCKLIVILDCCHSGSALDLPFEWKKSGEWSLLSHPWHSAGDVQMFSGCEDSQCSMDAHRHGKPGGAMTTALCDFLDEEKGNDITYPQLLDGLHKVLRDRKFDQKPKLSSSQAFDAQDKIFSFTDGMEPNRNPEVGQGSKPPPKANRPNASGFKW